MISDGIVIAWIWLREVMCILLGVGGILDRLQVLNGMTQIFNVFDELTSASSVSYEIGLVSRTASNAASLSIQFSISTSL